MAKRLESSSTELRVFISWSGDKGLALAEHLANWLPSIVPSVKAFRSPDIRGGLVWLKVLFEELAHAEFGIVCLTKDNLTSPWLHFEAGALGMQAGKSIPVCPILMDLRPSEVKGPIAFFQAKRFDERPMRELFLEIAKQARFDTNQASRNFLAVWPKLHADVRKDIRARRDK